MKANRPLIKNFVLGALSILAISLSGCLAYQNEAVQTAQVGDGPDAGILPQLGETVRLEGLRFKPDSAKMRSDSKPILDAAAQLLKSEPDKRLYVDAYCDQLGNERANLRLARQRAENVKSSLEARGISSERMIARGFGLEHGALRVPSSQTLNRNSEVELIPFANQSVSTNLAYSPSETSKPD